MKFSDIFVKDLFMKPVDHSEGGFVLVDQSGIMFKEYYSVCGGRYLFPKRAVKRIEYLRHLNCKRSALHALPPYRFVYSFAAAPIGQPRGDIHK